LKNFRLFKTTLSPGRLRCHESSLAQGFFPEKNSAQATPERTPELMLIFLVPLPGADVWISGSFQLILRGQQIFSAPAVPGVCYQLLGPVGEFGP